MTFAQVQGEAHLPKLLWDFLHQRTCGRDLLKVTISICCLSVIWTIKIIKTHTHNYFPFAFTVISSHNIAFKKDCKTWNSNIIESTADFFFYPPISVNLDFHPFFTPLFFLLQFNIKYMKRILHLSPVKDITFKSSYNWFIIQPFSAMFKITSTTISI